MKRGYKYFVHRKLLKDNNLVPHLPETYLYSEEKLNYMLDKYNTLILKPSGGTGGRGVFKVEKIEDSKFKIHSEKSKFDVTKKGLIKYIQTQSRTSKYQTIYFIQQHIDLLTLNNQPLDIRVMTGRKAKDLKWSITGVLAKSAGPKYFITNSRSRGKIVTLETALKSAGVNLANRKEIKKQLKLISLSSSKILGKNKPWVRIAGFDLGIDNNHQVWFIESNPKPAIKLFLKLKDKSMYRKIQEYL